MGDNTHSRTQADYLDQFDEYLRWQRANLRRLWVKYQQELYILNGWSWAAALCIAEFDEAYSSGRLPGTLTPICSMSEVAKRRETPDEKRRRVRSYMQRF